jgi:5'-methylthioadenosine phosphorylase
MEGPQFSTYAESQEYRRMGHDIIGMTAIPEAKLAREAELAYATMALVTDYDCWRPSEGIVDVDKVIEVLHKNVALSQRIIEHVVPKIGNFESPAHHALKHSIITRRDVMPKEKLEQVALLIGKYL